jgi:hypothetical protein
MRTTIAFLAFAWSVQLAVPARAAERASINRRTGLFEPPTSDLRKAADRGDRAELSRAATRLGPARLARLMADPERKMVLAALEAAPLFEAGLLLLQPMAPLMASPDEAIRARAVTSTATLFAQVDPARLADYEVAAETVAAACQALARAAANEAEQLSTRLTAVQGLVDAGPACVAHLRLDSLAISRDPEIRRAAVLAMPVGTDGKARAALLAASKDKDLHVAAAATARLCKAGEKHATLPPLRDLVVGDTALAEDVVDIVPCLASSPDPADQRTLTQLADSGRPAIRDAVKRLREARASRTFVDNPPKKQ